MADIRDTIISQIPDHIIEDHPRFFDFLEAYYEWMSQPDNPYRAIRDHLTYLNLDESLDAYVDMMKRQYLADAPSDVLVDKELFIKWSRKFNLARGSHASYKFLFRLLFAEDDTSIYLPKDNILRTSDGTWASGESTMLVTNSGNQSTSNFQRIFQRRQVYEDIYDYAYATVQRVRSKYAGRYNLTELTVTDVEGEFKEGYPIETEEGGYEWPIATVAGIGVSQGGTNHQTSQRVQFNNFDQFDVIRIADQDGSFDTRLTSFLDVSDISVSVNGAPINDYAFDGAVVTSTSIKQGDEVKVTLPAYNGYIIVDEIDDEGSVEGVDIIDTYVGYPNDDSLFVTGSGTGSSFVPYRGIIKPEKGRYMDNKGHLSSNMYLQDSFFYQEYSYVIKTQQDIDSYRDTVKQLLHPGGFLMYGSLSITSVIEAMLQIPESSFEVNKSDVAIDSLPGYSIGPNMSFFQRFKPLLSRHVYQMQHFDSLDMEYVEGEEGYSLDVGYVNLSNDGLLSPNLVQPIDNTVLDYSLSRLVVDHDYFNDRYTTDKYIEETANYYNGLKGWMTKDNLQDAFVYIQQSYSQESESGNTYMENGYTSARDN